MGIALFLSLLNTACKTNVHKRCKANVAPGCGIDQKKLADILVEIGATTSHKLTSSGKRKKVKLTTNEVYWFLPIYLFISTIQLVKQTATNDVNPI